MSKALKLQRVNNLIKVIYDDDTFALAYPSGSTLWYVGSGGDVPPDPDTFKCPFQRSLINFTSYGGHSGIDWPGASVGSGVEIKAIGPGTVIQTYDTNYNTYPNTSEPVWRGICVVIDHGMIGGVQIWSLYAHMSSRSVNISDTVVGGQSIGVIGNTGASTGTHLHMEVIYDGVRLNSSAPDPTGKGAGYERTLAWMDANAVGSWT
jgi:murein DD-endopeptidase MepM/ murein hydrolase activator NlpD